MRARGDAVSIKDRLWTADCGLRTTDCGLGIKYGLGIKRGVRTRFKIRTADYFGTETVLIGSR